MAPKRRAAAAAARAGGKKAKQEEVPKQKDAFTSAKEALLAAGPQVRGKRKVEDYSGLSDSGEVKGPAGLSDLQGCLRYKAQ